MRSLYGKISQNYVMVIKKQKNKIKFYKKSSANLTEDSLYRVNIIIKIFVVIL